VTWEAIVMFHAAGDALQPDELLKRHTPENALPYRKGESAEGGRLHSISGFKVDLGAANSRAQLEEKVMKHLQEHSALYADVANGGGEVSVGIGLMVPPKEPRTVTLTPRALAALGQAGVTVHVTGYPIMDETGEEEAAHR
jgi:hypothetical protein